MRLQVVLNSSGEIVGTVNREPQQLPDGIKIEFTAEPLEGQTIQEVDFDQDSAKLGVDELRKKLGDLVRRK